MAERRPPWSALVADDEPAARDVIASFLAGHASVRVAAAASNGEQTVQLVRRIRPDLLFLDVQMPDPDGFGVLEALGPDVPPGLIFVTAYDAHALRAFEVHALDYVLKPFGRPRFMAAVDRAIGRLEADAAWTLHRTLEAVLESRNASLPALLAEAIATTPRLNRLPVRTSGSTVLISISDVQWIEADRDYARLHTARKAWLINDRMSALEARLDPARFLRIHRSIIVNLACIREIRRADDGGGEAVLESGVRLRIARNRRAALERAFSNG